MKTRSFVLGICLLAGIAFSASAQDSGFRIAAYNVENLFDMSDDPGTDDKEYCFKGKKFWTTVRYNTKLRNIAKVVNTMNYSYKGGDIVVLSEVENRKVVEDLIGKTELADDNYGIIHGESADERGIDVAMIYDKTFFTPVKTSFYRIKEFQTRDIVYTGFSTPSGKVIHVFGVHMPSMRGGAQKSEALRMTVAGLLKEKVDSLYKEDASADIFICGDFNAVSGTPAMVRLGAVDPAEQGSGEGLYDLGYAYKKKSTEGSYCYKGHWQTLHHIVVSPSLLEGRGNFKVSSTAQTIFSEKFLLEENLEKFGWQPFPTYRGQYYKGGFSDHLPVYIDVEPVR